MIKSTTDVAEIKKVLSDVYDATRYDNSPDLKEFVPTGLWFILYEQEEVAGIINLVQLNNVTWMPHIIIFEKYRGANSTKWGRQVIDIMKNLGAKVLLAFTPYEQAKRHAEKLGFKHITTIKNSIQKNNKLLDQFILEKQL